MKTDMNISNVAPRKPDTISNNVIDKEKMGDNGNIKNNGLIQTLIQADVLLTNRLAICATRDSSYGKLRPFMIVLEYSCHGVPWLIFLFLSMTYGPQEFQQQAINLVMAIVVDLIMSFFLKSAFRRPRPAHNQMDMLLTVSVDHFSFPSGHCTRAGMLFTAFYLRFNFTLVAYICIGVWLSCVALSRVLLGRHHVLDVVCGLVIGAAQFCFIVDRLWLEKDACDILLSYVDHSLHLLHIH